MEEVRCRGCRRLLGVARRDAALYCDLLCATDYPVTSQFEARGAILEITYVAGQPDMTYAGLGKLVGFSRQRVEQICASRKITKVRRHLSITT